MLSEIKIQNYALIDELEISLGKSLNTITGETGAGKSIVLGALGLILGNRADSSVLLDQTRKCVIEAKFDVTGYGLESFFSENDLDFDNPAIVRREIAPGGKSRAFINDSPVNLQQLSDFGSRLVDIHNQHMTLKLLSPGFQMSLLDSFAGNTEKVLNFKKRFVEYRKKVSSLGILRKKQTEGLREHDYLRFQLDEIFSIGIKPGELKNLEEEQQLLENAESIRQVIGLLEDELYDGEQSIISKLSNLEKQLSSISKYGLQIDDLSKRLNGSLIELKDFYREAKNYGENINSDNERLSLINERLEAINRLLHKHRLRGAEELMEFIGELEKKLNESESLTDEIQKLETELQSEYRSLAKNAEEISDVRKSKAGRLEDNLKKKLISVGIPDSEIKIQINDCDDLNEYGNNTLEILFSANKGFPPATIANAASGGELSRLMLCFKFILAKTQKLPSIIFDEIDSGISGEVAIKVGKLLRELSETCQVICITHQPQVAAMGSDHYIVFKAEKAGKIATRIRHLKSDERIIAIAEMIAGKKPSLAAMENAKELLAGGVR